MDNLISDIERKKEEKDQNVTTKAKSIASLLEEVSFVCHDC